ncbi:retrotransposon protein [Cucumis melo var. makuwa]|uniref:Retrotransposon protein n=1 Tax=Cucumis melo var. makuwa TaxID=1194695 RepID=A0A5D3DH65_CUCMM|nr:retrotransposon protein [Cucumis melo var. makuwa]TYK22903.1 retrotransposon protein [Cucumis melo var. makuwa]
MVTMFLHVLAHEVKNSVIQREFVRSGKIVSRYFNLVLLAVLQLHDELIKKPMPNCLGAMDETYIKVNVPVADRPTFRTRKEGNCHKCTSYPNTEGFLASYRGQRYHLQECRGTGNAVTKAKVYFNMKYSLIRNVIERAFGVLKGRCAILCGKPYYPL